MSGPAAKQAYTREEARRLAGLAETGEELGLRRGRLARELVLTAAARLLVLVLALDAGGFGVRGQGTGVLSLLDA